MQYGDPTGLIDGATYTWWLLTCGGAGQDIGLAARGVGLGLYDLIQGTAAMATPQGQRAMAEGIANAYNEGGIGLAVNQINPFYHMLVNGDQAWQLAQQGCITESSRAFTGATFDAASTFAVAAGGVGLARGFTRTAPNAGFTRTAAETGAGAAEQLLGESHTYVDLTRGGSIRNVGTDATHSEFADTPTSSGWTSRTSSDGVVQIFQKDGAKYVLRSKNSSGYPG